MSRRSVHELYHSKTKVQSKIININNFTYRLLLEIINRYIKKKYEILDIGCGAGTISFYLASKVNNITGIDISSKAIAECIKTKRVLELKNINFKQMDFPNETPVKKFDLVLFTEVIEHLENDDKALRVIYRLLKPGGTIILSTPSINAPLHKLGLTKTFDKNVGHLRRYTLNHLNEKLVSSGFKIVESYKIEGIIRNFLFINPVAGKLVRFIKYFISDLVTFLDNISLKFFGESNYVIVAIKK